jgi:hypothetical protein
MIFLLADMSGMSRYVPDMASEPCRKKYILMALRQ